MLAPTLVLAFSIATQSSFHLAVVPNADSADASILDTTLHAEVARIPLGPRPRFATMSADGRYAYVAEEGQITGLMVAHQIDLDAMAVVDSISLPTGPITGLVELEVSPDGGLLAMADAHQALYGIETSTMEVAWMRRVCQGCPSNLLAGSSVIFTSDSRVLWVSAAEQGLLALYAATGEVLGDVPLPPNAIEYGYINLFPGMDSTPLLSFQSREVVRVFEGVSGSFRDLRVPDAYTLQETEVSAAIGMIATGTTSFGGGRDFMRVFTVPGFGHFDVASPRMCADLEFHPSNGEIWVETAGGVVPIDLISRTQGDMIPLSGGLTGTDYPPSFTQDGEFYYYPLAFTDEIAVVDVEDKVVVSRIPVGDRPEGVYMQGDNRGRP